ncbi:MAG: 2-dehydro-3-deoxy-D-gluconate 5-dehydrogenase [Verrucomicrobia subdivision 3 bacterium]|nr:2-dehydro-3-deoxy-D-gluconate 5-dehydrogenase [Limisphaerales bacterium]MCS1412968.1 2-dehydro-3-deoxy-D-gluconate 5-dehydrogenase [Limisphaerales bacterium]
MSVLTGKGIVVLGGTTGLGISAASAFVDAGAGVVVVGRNSENLDKATKRLGDRVAGLAGDARHSDTAGRAIKKAVQMFGAFDGLYHVAGGSGRRMGDGALHELTDSGWDETLALNLSSVFYSNRAAVRWFRDQSRGGTILNCGSVLGFSPAPRYFGTHAYAAAKAAIIGFTKSCAASYAKEGIRFNVIAPALVATPMSQRAQVDDAIVKYAKAKQPLAPNGIADASDVDGIAVYFMSDASHGVTGQVFAVDWGWCVSEG